MYISIWEHVRSITTNVFACSTVMTHDSRSGLRLLLSRLIMPFLRLTLLSLSFPIISVVLCGEDRLVEPAIPYHIPLHHIMYPIDFAGQKPVLFVSKALLLS